MSAFSCILIILFSLLNGTAQSAKWSAASLADGQQLYACAWDNVILTWKYTINSSEELGDVQWFYNGRSQEVVATSSRGIFYPFPPFSQRVTWVDNAGLTLSKVLVPDSGNYSVEVNVYRKADTLHNVLRRTVTIHVSEHLVTTDGALHVVQDPDLVYNNVTGQWVVQLQCGHFIFQDNPPFQVEWTTPSGHVYNSTSFSEGNFYFHIPMPAETGNYVCSIPAHLADRACLHGNVSQSKVAVRVESVEVRLLLLEKENWDFKHKLTMAQAEVTNLQTRLEKIEDAERHQVAFHATGLYSVSPSANRPLVFNQVVYNQGNAYSPYTGYFTAPYSGLYFFIAKTSADVDNGSEFHYLMVGSLTIDTAYTYDPRDSQMAEQSPVHGVVHLTQGQRVYVTGTSNVKIWNSVSAFTGFLLSRDP